MESEESHRQLWGTLWDLPSFTAPGVLSPASLSLDSSLTVESASEGETLQISNVIRKQKAKGGAGHAHLDVEVRLPGKTGRNQETIQKIISRSRISKDTNCT